MDNTALKQVGFHLMLTFVFFMCAQLIWTVSMFMDAPLLGSKHLEDMLIGQTFTVSGIFGLIAGIKLYKLNG